MKNLKTSIDEPKSEIRKRIIDLFCDDDDHLRYSMCKCLNKIVDLIPEHVLEEMIWYGESEQNETQ